MAECILFSVKRARDQVYWRYRMQKLKDVPGINSPRSGVAKEQVHFKSDLPNRPPVSWISNPRRWVAREQVHWRYRMQKLKDVSWINSPRRGQAMMEAVLIMLCFMAISYWALEIFNTKKPVVEFITKPWKTISGMMESGSWKERGPGRSKHPNHFNERMYSRKGKPPN